MQNIILEYSFLVKIIIITIFSACISSFIVPLIIKLGLKNNIVDIPNKRKSHKIPIVRIGGIAIAISLIISFLVALIFGWIDPNSYKLIKLILAGSLFFSFIGLIDDICTISPYYRLVFQIIVSTIIWQYGIRIDLINLSWIIDGLYLEIPSLLSLIFTVIWISAITNAFNWLDGLDGLAAGTCVVTASGFAAILYTSNLPSFSFLMASLIGSCIGFLFYNFYSAKIYMGDCGSYFIGFLISVLAINVGYSSDLYRENLTIINPLVPIIILFLPIGDMLFVIYKRISLGNSAFLPDRNHFHHRLIEAGFNHMDSVLFSYVVNQLFVSIALSIVFKTHSYYFLVISTLIIISFLFKKCKIKVSKQFKLTIASKNNVLKG